jgi:hypothetical protein
LQKEKKGGRGVSVRECLCGFIKPKKPEKYDFTRKNHVISLRTHCSKMPAKKMRTEAEHNSTRTGNRGDFYTDRK